MKAPKPFGSENQKYNGTKSTMQTDSLFPPNEQTPRKSVKPRQEFAVCIAALIGTSALARIIIEVARLLATGNSQRLEC